MGAGSPRSGSHGMMSSSSNQRNGLWEKDEEEEKAGFSPQFIIKFMGFKKKLAILFYFTLFLQILRKRLDEKTG